MLSSSLGTSARGTRGPARGRLQHSGSEGRALRASSAAAHGSGQPSWATPGPGKGTAAISVPGELPPPHHSALLQCTPIRARQLKAPRLWRPVVLGRILRRVEPSPGPPRRVVVLSPLSPSPGAKCPL